MEGIQHGIQAVCGEQIYLKQVHDQIKKCCSNVHKGVFVLLSMKKCAVEFAMDIFSISSVTFTVTFVGIEGVTISCR